MYKFLGILVVLSFLCIPINSYALEAISVTTGYLDSYLDHTEKNYTGIPLLIGLEFDVKPLISKIGINTKGRVDLILEPFIGAIIEPNNNVEVGSNFLMQYVFPLNNKFQPYVKGGLGVLYMSQHTREQATQYNFLSQGAAGIQFFIKDNVALNVEYRYRHLSNSSIKAPNSGINSDLYLCGVTFFFNDKKSKDN
ncbi:MAG: acyloxyacyl hydrolase [Candidatus Omnitrophota bacterium]|nr:acyloxyacyl hydrolase [Candidatus Omnitrophota bacterium]